MTRRFEHSSDAHLKSAENLCKNRIAGYNIGQNVGKATKEQIQATLDDIIDEQIYRKLSPSEQIAEDINRLLKKLQ